VKFIGVRRGRAGDRRAKALAHTMRATLVEAGKRPFETDIVWIAVPDDAIAGVARALASSQDWQGRIVFHSSGALTSDELAPLRQRGAGIASVHPMMTFVRDAAPELAGVAFALEGDAVAVRAAKSIIDDLGGIAFPIRKRNKVLYHVFGSFASPLVIALMASLEEVAEAAGVRRREIKPVMLPLLRQTLHNYEKGDAAAAFSGPLVRGDVATVRRHLAELKKLPQAREVYLALARAALKRLPARNRAALGRVLGARVKK